MDFNDVIEKIGMTIDAAGVVVIVTGAAIAFVVTAVRLSRRESNVYRRFRQQLGRAILLGLELLVAGDIVRTVAASPSLTSVAILAAIVLIRTFLSFSLEVKTTGRWPLAEARHCRALDQERPACQRRPGPNPCQDAVLTTVTHGRPQLIQMQAKLGQVRGSGWLSKPASTASGGQQSCAWNISWAPLEASPPRPGAVCAAAIAAGPCREAGVVSGPASGRISSIRGEGFPQPGGLG
jgi:uncharacterized membrane protein